MIFADAFVPKQLSLLSLCGLSIRRVGRVGLASSRICFLGPYGPIRTRMGPDANHTLVKPYSSDPPICAWRLLSQWAVCFRLHLGFLSFSVSSTPSSRPYVLDFRFFHSGGQEPCQVIFYCLWLYSRFSPPERPWVDEDGGAGLWRASWVAVDTPVLCGFPFCFLVAPSLSELTACSM